MIKDLRPCRHRSPHGHAELDADALLLLTDVAAVQDGYGTPQARPIRRATADELRKRDFPEVRD